MDCAQKQIEKNKKAYLFIKAIQSVSFPRIQNVITANVIETLAELGIYSLPANMRAFKNTVAARRRRKIVNSFPMSERDRVGAYLQLHATEELRDKIKASIPAVAAREYELRVCLHLMEAERRAGIRFRIHTQQMEAARQRKSDIAVRMGRQGR
jgi:hypothetical protein